MAVAYMISTEQRAMEIVASIDISHLDVCLNTPYFFTFCSTELVVRFGVSLGSCDTSPLCVIPSLFLL